jgi:schlafen family protein
MTTFRPILEHKDLPAALSSVEGSVLEFKGRRHLGVDDYMRFARDYTEHAKDIAAMANALGGAILVGADEQPGCGVVYSGIERPGLDVVRLGYDVARCEHVRPRPRVEFGVIPIADGDRWVLAVNVFAALEQPIAIAVPRDGEGPRSEEVPWRFPRRVGRDTRWIQPEELPMLINAHVRKMALLLERIPDEQRRDVEIQSRWDGKTGSWPHIESVMLWGPGGPSQDFVDSSANALLVRILATGTTNLRIPLDDIECVWQVRADRWRIRVNGFLGRTDKGYDYLSYSRR